MPEDIECPICGSETIPWKVKQGPNAGKRFYVCEHYPECKGRVPLTRDKGKKWLQEWMPSGVYDTVLGCMFFIVLFVIVGGVTAAIAHFCFPEAGIALKVVEVFLRASMLFVLSGITAALYESAGFGRNGRFILMIVGLFGAAMLMTFYQYWLD